MDVNNCNIPFDGRVYLPYISISFGLKSILSDIKMVTPADFLGPFAWDVFVHSFTLSLSLVVNCGS